MNLFVTVQYPILKMIMQMSEELLQQPVVDFSFAIPSAISQVVMLSRSSARFWTSFSLLASLILVTIPFLEYRMP